MKSLAFRTVTALFAAGFSLILSNPASATGSSHRPPGSELWPNTVDRDYGTPTPAPGKVCPKIGNIPVSVPVGTSPVGASVPGLAGNSLPKPDLPANIYGELCMSKKSLADARAGHPPPVILTVHGITYGTPYWDFPHKPEKYSAVNRLINDGYATLNIDRLGEGRSSHPPSPVVNDETSAESVHQIISKLRGGKIGGMNFNHVVLLGHSYGSAVVWLESALYNDADAAITSSFGGRIKPVDVAKQVSTAAPAATVPTTSRQPWSADPGYLQPRPGTRVFSGVYNTPNTDPNVIQTDEKLTNSVTVEELATLFQDFYTGRYKNIHIPMFLIQGENDKIFCGADEGACATGATSTDAPDTLEKDAAALQQYESGALQSKACLKTAVIPNMGHNINLHRNSKQTFDQYEYFLDQAIGKHGENRDIYSEKCSSQPPKPSDHLPEMGRIVPPISGVTG